MSGEVCNGKKEEKRGMTADEVHSIMIQMQLMIPQSHAASALALLSYAQLFLQSSIPKDLPIGRSSYIYL